MSSKPPRTFFGNVILPISVFLPFTYMMLKYLFVDVPGGTGTNQHPYCPIPFEGKNQYQQHYLGGYLPGIEKILCDIVSAWTEMVAPYHSQFHPFIWDGGASLWIYVAVPLVEAHRTNSPLGPWVVYTVHLLAQLLSGAAMLPIFWILFFVLSYLQKSGTRSGTIFRGDAEGIIFGTTFGYFLPSIIFINAADIPSNLVWQGFPFVLVPLSFLYRQVRPKGTYKTSGHSSVGFLYTLIFLVCFAIHLQAFKTVDYSISALLDVWAPRLTLNGPGSGIVVVMIDILRWDLLVIFTSILLAALWIVPESFVEGGLIVLWFAVGSVLFSPGSALSAIWWWRERKLQVARQRKKI